MNALLSDSDPAADWERLRPTIDDAIQELGERDREAVLLRFFENRPFAEIGAVLRVSEDAARMRVERALDRLRDAFARRGVTSTGTALAAILASQAGVAAPAGLAGAITGAALAGVGFLQASRRTCVARAREGTFEHDDFSKTPAASDDVQRSRKVAAGINRDAALIGLGAVALTMLATKLSSGS